MTPPMNWEQVCALGLSLPEVEVSVWFRTPALKVRGKSFVRLKEDGETLVFLLDSVDEQEMLIQARPELYYITDHYRGWPAVLARLTSLDAEECRLRLEQGWRLKAPRKLVKAWSEAAMLPELAKVPATASGHKAKASTRAARSSKASSRSQAEA